ncbi:hypothetical protein DFQ01_10147 [Paenibacillus cellulosilyticus]|uniref:HAD superfamily hydrolase (TIGR01549 family) n=1 Tax=Paenibacillus cellulosilyticus TaxID=375489 RepID=A0A2V2Z220_9BACL|nr:hypothetical protein [Paenibacillus cellulosilyticus]PWW08326.1 hypothetical protein DFQ01_10147 [Paenibacillus cellulosilyticus]QKS47925.1 hypothetical protein HUB94_26885 [Paenibacillus cellulosilyticus]
MNKKTMQILKVVTSPDIKVVSFDIFDTLLVRPVVSPVNLFKIVSFRTNLDIKFKEMRMMAERVARLNRPNYEDDITYDDIYREFSNLYKFSADEIELLKQTELQVEYDYLYARKTIREIFHAAIQAGKEVIITSDMYLPKEFLIKVLNKNGYTGFSKLYLSSDEKLSKGSGRLFKKMAADFEARNISPKEIVHIGDNKEADIDQAKKNNINAYHTPSPISIFKSKRILNSLSRYLHASDNSFMVGFIANSLFDDPYHPFNTNSIVGNDISNFGTILFGPFLLSYTKWMLEDALVEKLDTINFVYRDGYLPLQIYTLLKEVYPNAPQTSIIYLSRAMRYNYYAHESNGFYKALIDLPPSPKMTVDSFIKTRLLITDPEERSLVLGTFKKHGFPNSITAIGNVDEYIKVIKEIEPFFIENAKKRMRDIDSYCLHVLDGEKRLGIFDVGYRGSVSRLIKDRFEIDNIGYHILSLPMINSYSKINYKLKTFIEYDYAIRHETQILSPLLEDIISVQESSVIHAAYDSSGPQYYRQDTSVISTKITSIQESVIELSKEFIALFKDDLRSLNLDGLPFYYLLVDFLKKPSKSDAMLLKDINFADSAIISADIQDVYGTWFNSKFKNKDELFTDSFIKDINSAISNISNGVIDNSKDNILIVGDMVSYDKGICDYLNKLSIDMPDVNFVLLSEATYVGRARTAAKILFDFIITPTLFGKNRYVKGQRLVMTKEVVSAIEKNEYLAEAIDNLKTRHPEMGDGYAEVLLYWASKYFQELIDSYKPKAIILWNKFHALHHVFTNLSMKNGITPLFMEFGALPGTFVVENLGQMGESYPAKHWENFKNLDVNDKDLNEAERVLQLLRKSKLNRNIQPINNMKNELLGKIDSSKPIIFYAGQNDFESGLYPYTHETKESHSPIFKSSNEAAVYLAKLAEKNGWNFIYKPHPLMLILNKDVAGAIPENTIVVSDIDINDMVDLSDLTITILSQTGYVSSIRRRPTLMLGYTQLRGKGCSYEAFTLENIEETINIALKNGFTSEQEAQFGKHVAQLIKYYLYDDRVKKELHFGRSIEQLSDFLRNVVGRHEAERIFL